MELPDIQLKPYKWLNEARIFNKNDDQISNEWLETNADAIALLFTSNGIDKDGVIEKFYEIYENVKFVNLPLEVIFIPMDESEVSYKLAYEKQANWFTLKLSDPLVSELKYMYGITCIPNLVVIKFDGTIISNHGVQDLEEYGKNAVITWTSQAVPGKTHRKLSKELSIYGDKWRYMNAPTKRTKPEYRRRFSELEEFSKSS